jgi:hypothetical protein
MQMQHRRTAGAFVQVVYVLSHEREARHALRQCSEGSMTGVGLCGQHNFASPLVPSPNKRRIAAERGWSRKFHRIESLPEPGLLIAERRHTALGRCT